MLGISESNEAKYVLILTDNKQISREEVIIKPFYYYSRPCSLSSFCFW